MRYNSKYSRTKEIPLSQPASAVYQHIVESVPRFIPHAEGAVLHRLNEAEQILLPVAAAGSIAPGNRTLKIEVGKGAAGLALAIGTTIKVSDILIDSRIIPPTPGATIRSLLVSPLCSPMGCVGTLSAHSSQLDAFTDEDALLLETLASQAVKDLEGMSI